MPSHPPAPGDIVTPNFLAVEEALGNVTFPIWKRDLLAQVNEGQVILNGRNIDLDELIAQLPSDYFESERDVLNALEDVYGATVNDSDPEPLPSGPPSGWQADVGPGNSGDASAYFEPGE